MDAEPQTIEEAGGQHAIVLHEDKNYYPAASEVYPEAEVLIGDEDTQPIEQAIVGKKTSKQLQLVETTMPETTFDAKYLAGLMDLPHLVRHVCVLGHLHHGKTTLLDSLVRQTHPNLKWHNRKDGSAMRYLDTRTDEQSRALSIKCTPISLVLPGLTGKHYALNVMDTPGHLNFSDEVTAAMRLADGACVVVDAAEGVMLQTERALRAAAEALMPVTLVLNQVDRLILELKLPPADAYFKLCHTLDECNAILAKCGSPTVLSPSRGNVAFASGLHGWSFTVKSFAHTYAAANAAHGKGFDADKLAPRLWGDAYFHEATRTFKRKPENSGDSRSFVKFVLEPLYKIYSHALGAEGAELKGVCEDLRIAMKPHELKQDPRPLLRTACQRFFGESRGVVDMLVHAVPSPIAAARAKVTTTYTGQLDTAAGRAMLACDAKGPLMVNVTKVFARSDCENFDAYGRVLSGTVRVGDRVRVLGEGYSLEDEEDMSERTVSKIWIYQGRYRVEVNRVTAGNWALFEGVEAGITKTATMTALIGDGADEAVTFKPLQFDTVAAMRVAVEPVNPSELPKMLDGLRRCNKTYPLLETRVEESGEHVVLGTGELYLDCAMHDLRRMYTDIEIKIADPVVRFCETVIETSSLQSEAETPNTKNKLTMIAEPLDDGVANDIEAGNVRLDWTAKEIGGFFTEKYDWDALAARSVWSFGPTNDGANILCDDTLGGDTDKKALRLVRAAITQGFQWGAREGPLCDEPIRGVKFKLTAATIASEAMHRSGGQIIPTARRACYSSFLLASPRLMEPIYLVEILAPPACVSAVYNVLSVRRGHVVSSEAKAGTPMYTVHAYIPLIDSFGFETDLRTHTQGQAFCMSTFDHWEIVPGDPLDKSIELRPLEPAPHEGLAREFMIKTRRRKGLSEDVAINKYFDEHMLVELAKRDAELAGWFQKQ
jgi:U5 small nuclear ribonucleoprotein component